MYLIPPATSQQELLKTDIETSDSLYLYLEFQLCLGFQHTLPIILNSCMSLKKLATKDVRLQPCPNLLF